VGRSLQDLKLRERKGISVVAVHDMLRDEMRPAPDPTAPLKESDTLLVAGREQDLAKATQEKSG
jgi:trk system potassium uptake protein TrkA